MYPAMNMKTRMRITKGGQIADANVLVSAALGRSPNAPSVRILNAAFDELGVDLVKLVAQFSQPHSSRPATVQPGAGWVVPVA
jgi:hypothetical protein